MSNKVRTITLLIAFALFVSVAAFAYNTLSDQVKPQTDIGEAEKIKAPDFTVIDSDGNPVLLSDLFGKPIILNFWTSWCPPCKQEMPEFDKLYKEFGEDVQFMMINTLDRDTVETGKEFVAEAGYTFPLYFDTNKNEATINYGIRAYPTTIFIDKDGYIAAGSEGALDEKALREGIDFIM